MIDPTPLLLSLRVAATATLVALALGLALAWVLARLRFPGRDLLDTVVTLPLVLPPTVLGYYLLVVLGSHSPFGRAWETVFGAPLTFTVTAAVIAAAVHALPIIVKGARAAIEQVPETLEASARLLGASGWRVFHTVTLPLAARGVLAVTLLAFARALGDFGTTLMVAGNIPGRTQTASLAIYDAVMLGDDRTAGVLAVLVSMMAVAILWSTAHLTRRVLS
jgi:molybdate transport system permease protein